MKKLLVGVLALSALVACNKNEVIEQVASPAIQFENAFVDNATRAAADPSTTTENLKAFEVYGFMDQVSGVVFNDELVTRTGENNWTYANTQYWTPGHSYYFAALAPVDGYTLETPSDNTAAKLGVGTVSFENTDGSADLIYAAEVKENVTEEFAQSPEKVKFTFSHLLSKVKFTFENGFKNENAKVIVENIKMTVPSAGEINLAQADWWTTNKWVVEAKNANATTLDFGSTDYISLSKKQECAQERLTIPQDADAKYTITFTASLYYGNQVAGTYNHTVELTGNAFEIGKAYNISATLNADNIDPDKALKPIEFDVIKVKEWVDGDVINNGELLPTEVDNATALVDAINAGQSVILEDDITLTDILQIGTPMVKSEDASTAAPIEPICINLNGKTLTGAIKASVPVVIENGSIVNSDIYVVYTAGDGKKVSTVVYADNTLITLNNVEVTSDYTAVLAYNKDEDTVPSATGTPETGLIIKNSKLAAPNSTTTYALYAAGYNKVDIIDSELSGAGAAYLCSVKANIVRSELTASEIVAMYLACAYVEYDANTTIVGMDGDMYVHNYGKDIWASYINGEKADYGYVNVPEAVADAASLKAAMTAGGTYILTNDITITEPLSIDKNVILFLNGKSITNRTTFSDSGDENAPNYNCYVFWVKENGNLTVKGNGKVSTDALSDFKKQTDEYHMAVWAMGGTVNIFGGEYYNSGEGSDLIYASKGGKVNIYGGYFQAVEKQEGVPGTNEQFSALNVSGTSGGDFDVYGGSFYKFDPSNNKSENPKENFVVTGYKVKVENDVYTVVAE